MEKVELRAIIKYFDKKGLSPKQIHEELVETLRDKAPSYSMVKTWCADFKRGRTSTEDASRSGRPREAATPEIIEDVHDMVYNDRRVTVRHVSESLGIAIGTVHNIITEDLGMNKVSARWVPRMLTEHQKRNRKMVCRDLLKRFNDDQGTFIDRIVTQDETWVHHYDPETKMQSMQWKHPESPAPRKFRVVPSAKKVMASVFWDSGGVLMVDYLPKGQTITGNYYAEELRRLREAIKEKRRGKLTRGVLLLQDNAPAHTSQVAVTSASHCGFELLPHPPYSPDLAPSDYYLFPKLKLELKGHRFGSNEEVISSVDAFLGCQPASFFSEGLQLLESRWRKCIAVNGDYVEK